MRQKKRTFAESPAISINAVTLVPFMNREELKRSQESLSSRQMTQAERVRHFGPYGGDAS